MYLLTIYKGTEVQLSPSFHNWQSTYPVLQTLIDYITKITTEIYLL